MNPLDFEDCLSSSSDDSGEGPLAPARSLLPGPPATLKLFFNGLTGVGKTTFLIAASGAVVPPNPPMLFENFAATRPSRKYPTLVSFGLWDSGVGGEDYARCRPLSYPLTDVMVLCCDASRPETLEAIERVYLPEVVHFVPAARRVLLVLKTDLRAAALRPISHDDASAFARRHDMPLIEVSARTGDGMLTALDDIIDYGLDSSAAFQRRLRRPAIVSRIASTVRSWFD